MTFTLLTYALLGAALGAVLAWAGLRWLQRTHRRTLTCIVPYVPAQQRQALPPAKP